MAQRIINIGTSANKGNGDPIRTAFDKCNDNFTEVYSKITALENGTLNVVVSDVKGSVHADDSTLMIDGVSAQVVGPVNNTSVTTTTLTATTIVGDVTGDLTGDVVGTVTGSLIGNSQGYHIGDIEGSVFADDSTLLVDGVAGKIVGDIKNSLIETDNITALPGASDLFIQGGIYSGTPGNRARVNIGTTNTSTIILGAGDTDIYFNGTPGSSVVAGRLIGDLTGSVFGDDSTVLVDSVAGIITGDVENGRVITGIVRSETDANLYVYASGTGIVVLAGQSDLTIGHTLGEIDIYGDVEFNSGTTAFQPSNSVDFNCPVDFTSATVTLPQFISLATLKTEVAASADFADFQARIAAL